MASSVFNHYVANNGQTNLGQVVNVEFVEKTIDKIFDGKGPPSIETGVTLDFNAGGGEVYVKTPVSTNNQGEFPDTSVIANTYTKAVIDTKLSSKSEMGHTHTKEEITNFPTAMKNPQPLIINGDEYDGSNSMEITIATVELFDTFVTLENIEDVMNGKANVGHDHIKDDIVDFAHTHTMSNITDFPNDLMTEGDMNDKITILQEIIDTQNEKIEQLQELIDDLTTRVDNL